MKLPSGDKRSEESELLDVHLDDEDHQEDEIQHRNLKRSIFEISGKHGQFKLRKELTNTILNIQSKDKVSLEDLISKDNKNEQIEVKKKLLKEVVLEKPMPKAEHEKIRRQIGYDEAVKVTSEWVPVVTENRKAVQMKFPLMQSDIASITKPKDLGKDQKPTTKLEQEVAKVLKGSAKGPMTREEERVLLSHLDSNSLHGISLKGAQEMRAEYLKQKALVSYYAAKMKRQNKIKSKKFHRIQKKTRQKQEGQKLEVLKDKDPEAYREWMLKEEKRRIEERMTLKHKGGSKHMKKQMSYAKYNPESRQAVNDMLEKGKELTQKRVHFSDDEDDGHEDNVDDDECSEAGDVEEDLGSSKDNFSKKRPLEDDGEGFEMKHSKKHKKQKTDESDVMLSTTFEAVEEQDMVVDDKDILADFKEEKAAVEERDKVKDVNTFMEGWGSWSGKGIKVPKKKMKRFIIKAPEGPPRKDHKLNNVIISELKDESVAKLQVDALPWKFSNVQQFQESIRKPVGKQWNKEDKYRQKIKPKVVVKMGSIIEPLNKTEALKNYKGGNKEHAAKNKQKSSNK